MLFRSLTRDKTRKASLTGITIIFKPSKGIPAVPVLVRDPLTNIGIIAITDTNGCATFTDLIQNKEYEIMEVFGYGNTTATTVSFQNATELYPTVIQGDPTLEHLLTCNTTYFKNEPAPSTDPNKYNPGGTYITTKKFDLENATTIVSLTSNYKSLIMSNNTSTHCFIDAPARNEPLVLNDYSVIGRNYITKLAGGTCGSYSITSSENYSYPSSSANPYLRDVNEYLYVRYVKSEPNDSRYTIVNQASLHNFTWFDMTGHSDPNQTSSFLQINGSASSIPFFTETIS